MKKRKGSFKLSIKANFQRVKSIQTCNSVVLKSIRSHTPGSIPELAGILLYDLLVLGYVML